MGEPGAQGSGGSSLPCDESKTCGDPSRESGRASYVNSETNPNYITTEITTTNAASYIAFIVAGAVCRIRCDFADFRL